MESGADSSGGHRLFWLRTEQVPRTVSHRIGGNHRGPHEHYPGEDAGQLQKKRVQRQNFLTTSYPLSYNNGNGTYPNTVWGRTK